MSGFSNFTAIILAIIAYPFGWLIWYLSYKRSFTYWVIFVCSLIPCGLHLTSTYFAYMTDLTANSPPAAFYLHLTLFFSAGFFSAPAYFLASFILTCD